MAKNKLTSIKEFTIPLEILEDTLNNLEYKYNKVKDHLLLERSINIQRLIYKWYGLIQTNIK